jgi:hypothetical protein
MNAALPVTVLPMAPESPAETPVNRPPSAT